MSDLIEQKTSQKVLDAALKVLEASSPVLSALTGVVIESAKETERLQGTGKLEALDAEARKQAISLNMAKMQAVVAQELAIAERIKNAHEVEIEEYYEGVGAAGLNASGNLDGASISLGGESRKVTKRVYRFTGDNNQEQS
ncbi:hypothetical protein OA7_0008795 [Vibrio cyclitrophicus 1F53]|uniref:hypothetical protein n=1 Tax=Vibrio cyclitrophicus TaxID=47951 RepID=UPI0002F41C71|nr:hypothetical protein [Vibrio cyclitrophicus]OEF34402.1 hypothetical protein OA7_08535 [Vibrio cyclitrophicus 1F53]OEF67073.1 hypothetical protein OAA_06535 [Vibrio cyclitrophicus 1F175]PMH33286.1 hypothetical protein BCU72_01625 [Vibrio cyclitrophicus]PMH79178.1 hypothetical protein BCU60_19840 [Vibrio cyclitrophicus]